MRGAGAIARNANLTIGNTKQFVADGVDATQANASELGARFNSNSYRAGGLRITPYSLAA